MIVRSRRTPLTMLVPSHALGMYVAAGFVLADAPRCGGARVVLPRASRVNRVPDNSKKLTADPSGGATVKDSKSDDRHNRSGRHLQAR
jgi:hypothetical protein